MRTLKSCLLATALVALAIPAAANAAGNDPVATAATSVMHTLHSPTDAANDTAQGVIDVAEGNVGTGAGEVRDGVGCLVVKAINVGMTLGISLFDESAGTHDSYYRAHCIGHENDAGKTLAKLGVPAGPKLAGTVTLRDLAGIAIDTSMGLAAFSGTSAPVARFLEPSAAAVGDAAGAGEH